MRCATIRGPTDPARASGKTGYRMRLDAVTQRRTKRPSITVSGRPHLASPAKQVQQVVGRMRGRGRESFAIGVV